MAVIDKTYFEKGFSYIPNNEDISARPVGTPTNETELDFFIEEYERELLLNALGTTLYAELIADLPGLAIQKWKDLVDGKSYTDANGNEKRWDGLRGFQKQGAVTFYVFCQFLRNDNETYATVGVTKNNAKNAEVVDSTQKYIKSWRSFIKTYQGSQNNTTPSIIVNRSGSVGYDWLGGGNNVQMSMYQYLVDQNDLDESSFPDFDKYFKFYENSNNFGI